MESSSLDRTSESSLGTYNHEITKPRPRPCSFYDSLDPVIQGLFNREVFDTPVLPIFQTPRFDGEPLDPTAGFVADTCRGVFVYNSNSVYLDSVASAVTHIFGARGIRVERKDVTEVPDAALSKYLLDDIAALQGNGHDMRFVYVDKARTRVDSWSTYRKRTMLDIPIVQSIRRVHPALNAVIVDLHFRHRRRKNSPLSPIFWYNVGATIETVERRQFWSDIENTIKTAEKIQQA